MPRLGAFAAQVRRDNQSVLDQYGRMRNRLATALAALAAPTTLSVAKTYFSVVSPATDPITGS